MPHLLHWHQLVHRYNDITDIDAKWDFHPRLKIATVRLCVIDSQGEEHNKDTYAAPHNLKELPPLSLHLLLLSLHPQVLKPSSLHINWVHWLLIHHWLPSLKCCILGLSCHTIWFGHVGVWLLIILVWRHLEDLWLLIIVILPILRGRRTWILIPVVVNVHYLCS